MEYLSRSRLPVFTPRLDLTAEDLNAQAETICAALNELAGRLFIIKDMIPEEERAQYAEESSYPILDEIKRIWDDIQKAWDTITKNKQECEEHYQETMERITELDQRLNQLIQEVKQELLNTINAVDKKHDDEEERIESKFDISFSDLEKRFNALDDAAARKADVATLFDRIRYIQENSLPNIGRDGYWYIGKIKTDTLARGPQGDKGETGDSGVYLGQGAPTNGANVWIDPDGEGDDTSVDYGLDSGVKVCEEGELEENAEAYNSTYGAIITKVPYSLDAVETTADSGFDIDADIDEHTHIKATMDVATKELSTTVTNIGEESRMFWDVKVSSEPVPTSLVMGVQTTLQPRSSKTVKKVLTSEEFETLSTSPEPILYTAQHCEELNNENSREKITVGGVEVLTNSSKDNSVHYMYPTYVEEGTEFDANANKLVCVYAAGTEAKPENISDVYCMGKKIGSGGYDFIDLISINEMSEWDESAKAGDLISINEMLKRQSARLDTSSNNQHLSSLIIINNYMKDDWNDNSMYSYYGNLDLPMGDTYLGYNSPDNTFDIYISMPGGASSSNGTGYIYSGNPIILKAYWDNNEHSWVAVDYTYNRFGSEQIQVKGYNPNQLESGIIKGTFDLRSNYWSDPGGSITNSFNAYIQDGYFGGDAKQIQHTMGICVLVNNETNDYFIVPFGSKQSSGFYFELSEGSELVLEFESIYSSVPGKKLLMHYKSVLKGNADYFYLSGTEGNTIFTTIEIVDDSNSNEGSSLNMVICELNGSTSNDQLSLASAAINESFTKNIPIITYINHGYPVKAYFGTLRESQITTDTTVFHFDDFKPMPYRDNSNGDYNRRLNQITVTGTWSNNVFTATRITEYTANDGGMTMFLPVGNTIEYTPTSNYNPATKKYVDDSLKNLALPLVSFNYDDSKSSGYKLNTEENKAAILAQLKKAYNNKAPVAIVAPTAHNATTGIGGAIGTRIYIPSDVISSASQRIYFYDISPKSIGGIRLKIEVLLSSYIYNSSCTVTSIICYEDGTNRYLSTSNEYSYTPTSDYNPATKKYVDDLIGDINTLLDNIIGGE